MSNLPELRITTISERRLSLQVQQTEREPKAYISLEGWEGERGYSDLTSEEAYKIVDFITENIDRPEPPKEPSAWDHWLDLTDGTEFRGEGSSTVYTKQGDYVLWNHGRASYLAENMKPSWFNLAYHFLTEVPKPTVAEQVFALPIGAQFRWGWDDGGSRVKVSESRYWSSLGDTTYPIEDLDDRAQVEVIE